jgi:hypothetical protein
MGQLAHALALPSALAAPAADPICDAKGLNQNRDYFSELPYEHVDSMTGNRPPVRGHAPAAGFSTHCGDGDCSSERISS